MDTRAILSLMRQTADEIITPRFTQLAADEIHAKDGRGDLVTIADTEAEQYLIARLREAFPDALVVGEETIFEQPHLLRKVPTADHVLLIDPIDGTKNFVRGKQQHGVIVTELREGLTTRGWIWQPQVGHSYVCEAGAGVERDGELLRAVPRTRLPLGASSMRAVQGWDADGVLSPVISTQFACCFDYPSLIDGEIDYVHYKSLKPWDHLAGTLMVSELGGVAKLLTGELYGPASEGPGMIVAATPQIWDQVSTVWPVTPPAAV